MGRRRRSGAAVRGGEAAAERCNGAWWGGGGGSGGRARSGLERQARRRDFGSRLIAGVFVLPVGQQDRRTRVLASASRISPHSVPFKNEKDPTLCCKPAMDQSI